MIRRYNYTGRVTIASEYITITQRVINGSKQFGATVNFQTLGFPDNAKVYIEPYFKSSFMRFDFGTVSRIANPADTRLSEIPITDRILYRVKVVDETATSGLILGFADGLIADSGDGKGGRTSILPVDFNDLGSRIWKLDFRLEGPILSVNHEGKINNIRETVKSDPKFNAFVYPEVIRQIAYNIASNPDYDFNDDPSGWESKWVKFFQENLSVSHLPPSFDEVDAIRWSDDVSEAFCRKKNVIRLLEV